MLFAAGQFRRGRTGKQSSSALYSGPGWLPADQPSVERFIRELESRREYSQSGQRESAIFYCDAKDGETIGCEASIVRYYSELDSDSAFAGAPLVASRRGEPQ